MIAQHDTTMENETHLLEIESRSPVTGEVLGRVPAMTRRQAAQAVHRARAAQRTWAATPMSRRRRILERAAQIIEGRADDLARRIHLENGKPTVEALVTEVVPAAYAVQHVAKVARRQLRDRHIAMPLWWVMGKRSFVTHEPLGVVGIISPWNYPFGIPVPQVAAALIAGNAVVMKPSSATALVAEDLADVFRGAGVPSDVLQVVQGRGSIGEGLIEGGVDHLIFTGSVEVGRRVNALAAQNFIPTTMELGGKDPMLVLDDADVDVASSGALWAGLCNAGQTCASVERVYVHRSLYDTFVEAVVTKARQLRVGPGDDADVGSMTRVTQMDIVQRHIDDAVEKGAKVLVGGKRVEGDAGQYYEPTVLVDVDHDMAVMREETFGPVIPIMAFDHVDQAVQWANRSDLGLSASIWTGDTRRGQEVALRLETGTVSINDAQSAHGIAEAPWGGIKDSGVGRTHGELGLMAMVRPLHVSVDAMPHTKKVWWYPYDEPLRQFLHGFMKVVNGRSPWRQASGLVGVVKGFLTRRRL